MKNLFRDGKKILRFQAFIPRLLSMQLPQKKLMPDAKKLLRRQLQAPAE
jgi:hypothetical protein